MSESACSAQCHYAPSFLQWPRPPRPTHHESNRSHLSKRHTASLAGIHSFSSTTGPLHLAGAEAMDSRLSGHCGLCNLVDLFSGAGKNLERNDSCLLDSLLVL